MTDPAYNVTKLFTVRYFFRKIDCQDRALFFTGGHLGLNCSESSLGTTTSSPRRSPLLWREKPPGDKVVMEMSAGGGRFGRRQEKRNKPRRPLLSSIVCPLFKSPRGLIYFKHIWGRELDRDGGLFERGHLI